MNKIVLILFTIIVFILGCRKSDEEPYKNIIVIVGDDHSAEVTGIYGNELIRTPNIDKLARNGVRFTNAYSNSPICSASRQSVLSGKYPHASGVNLLFTPFNDDANYTIAEYLQDKGYKTCLIGKTHFNDWLYYQFWDEWPDYGFDTMTGSSQWKQYLKVKGKIPVPDSVLTRENAKLPKDVAWDKNAQVLPSEYFDEESEGTFFAGSAIDFIKANKENPFFLWLAFHEPHAPFNFPIEYAGRYKPEYFKLEHGSPEDDRWIPEQFKGLTDEEKRGIIASYYTSVEYMDKNIGLLLDGLEAEGLKENTLIIYFGDQGYLLNDHKRFEKHTMWAESVKAPLVISGSKLNSDKQIDLPVEFIDIAPTICEYAGLPIYKDFQGKSLKNLIMGNTNNHKDYVFAEFLEDNKAMVANEKWKYIFTTGKRDLGVGYETGFGPSGIIHRLYDLENDPEENTNLAYKQQFNETVTYLQSVMLDRFLSTHPNADIVPSGLNTIGKLIWFCEPTDIGSEPGLPLQRIFEDQEIY